MERIVKSSRAMARTGLRMMPTFPSPPLKSRTVGFPQYGFKASMSDSAFLNGVSVKPAPGIPSPLSSLPPPFARVPLKGRPGTESRSIQASTCRCTGGFPPYPRGPWLRSELCCLDPSSPNSTPCASPAGSSRFRFYTYTQCLRCAGAPRRPAGPSLLSLAVLSLHAVDPTPAVHRVLPLYSHGDSRLPRISNESPPANTRLCQQFPTGHFFRGCIVLFMLRPAGLPSPPDWLRQDEATCTSPCLLRYIVTPAFGAVRQRTALGVRLDGRTGNLPSSGLSPDKLRQLVRLHTNDK
jgi:hypothetical protein